MQSLAPSVYVLMEIYTIQLFNSSCIDLFAFNYQMTDYTPLKAVGGKTPQSSTFFLAGM